MLINLYCWFCFSWINSYFSGLEGVSNVYNNSTFRHLLAYTLVSVNETFNKQRKFFNIQRLNFNKQRLNFIKQRLSLNKQRLISINNG